jgi:histidine triad (HIT) family protein
MSSSGDRSGGALPFDPACVFCTIVRGDADAHIVDETEHTIAFLDRRPVFFGHTLLLPRAHYVTLPDLPADLLAPLFGEAQRLAAAMPEAFDAAGSFVAMNNVVSQSVAHLHVHVVPRQFKDGLKGFFWPRTKYRDDAHAAETAAKIRAALTQTPSR